MRANNFLLAFAVFRLAPTACFAQKPAVCHIGQHDHEYKMTVMAAPPLRTGLGSTTLKMTTQSERAQQYFQQGVSLLHCFWDFEAYRAFKEAARLDPNAAMAYWGIVQSITSYKAMEDEKKTALDKVKELLDKASDHEQYYLRGLQKQEEKDGHEEFAGEMEALIVKYPEDLDAKLFLAINSDYGYDKDGRPHKGAPYSLMLVENVLASHPQNAAANHYFIHVLEPGPFAERARHAADVLAALAPASGHMVHMPGHIYYKLGDQELARHSFLASMRVDREYMTAENVSTDDDWNYAHNLSYLIASDAEAGRYKEALEMAGKLDQLPANPFLAKGRPTHATTVGSAAMRLQLRFSNWQEAIDHPVSVGDEKLAGPAAIGFRDAMAAYARGMQALDRKQFDKAAQQADALDALQWRLKSEQLDEKDKIERVFGLLQTASLDLRGNLKCLQGDREGGYSMLRKAIEEEKQVGYAEPPQYSRPELESLGYAYLGGGEYDKARQAFQDELALRPKSGHALYGIALSYEQAGKKQDAHEAYVQFLDAWKSADPDLPMMAHARSK